MQHARETRADTITRETAYPRQLTAGLLPPPFSRLSQNSLPVKYNDNDILSRVFKQKFYCRFS